MVAVTGRADADDPARKVVDQLSEVGLDMPPWPEPVAPVGSVADVVRAADPADEARRRSGDRGLPARWRCAGARCGRVARALAVRAHRARRTRRPWHHPQRPCIRLAQTITGRTLLSLLDWPRQGYPRDDIMRALRGAPIRGPAAVRSFVPTGGTALRAAPASSLASISGARVAASRQQRLERVERLVDDEMSVEDDWRLAAHDELLAFIEQLARRRSWRQAHVAWAVALGHRTDRSLSR